MNKDIVPASPGGRRLALIVWLIVAVGGSLVIWWLTSSLNDLTVLARTDRDAAIALFKGRVLPAFVLTVLVGVAGGVMLMRQGMQVVRSGEFPPPGMFTIQDAARQRGRAAHAIGWLLAATGFLLAAVPLAILGIIFWVLRGL